MELSSLTAARGLPDFDAFGPEMCVPFEVRPLRRARVLWLNEGWLLQSGVDIQDIQVRHQVSQALLEEFAVSSSPDDFRHTHGKRRTLLADRYGASGGMPHGGSGRCGLSKCFNAKGIGRTPLAPENVDWDHSHGFLWLEEAIREVVGAEIAAAELPHGAVPVIAVIDTGIEFSRGHGEPARRRAIVVRPNFLRPAHFERSLYFGSAGQPNSEQFLDAQRVRRMVGEGSVCLRQLFESCARQLGAARALRLWQGRFLTSNIAVDGSLVDFGSFRAVANWRRASGLPGEVFGQEGRFLRMAVESLCFYFRKYGARRWEVPEPGALVAQMERIVAQEFDHTTLRAFGLDASVQPRAAAGLLERIHRYYERQQRELVRVDDHRDLRRPWIYDLIRPGSHPQSLRSHRPCNESFALALHLFDAFPETDSTGVTLLAAQRWFRPRPHLLYGLAARGARSLCRRLASDGDQSADPPARYVDRQLTRSRRHWPLLPTHLDVQAQACSQASSVLYCRHKETGESRLWIEGRLSPRGWHAFGVCMPLADIGLTDAARVAGIEVREPAISDSHGGRITIAGREIDIPPAGLRYGP